MLLRNVDKLKHVFLLLLVNVWNVGDRGGDGCRDRATWPARCACGSKNRRADKLVQDARAHILVNIINVICRHDFSRTHNCDRGRVFFHNIRGLVLFCLATLLASSALCVRCTTAPVEVVSTSLGSVSSPLLAPQRGPLSPWTLPRLSCSSTLGLPDIMPATDSSSSNAPAKAAAASSAAAASKANKNRLYIKQVVINGFKTYKDQTPLPVDFHPGSNIVVGFNGSGKSNFFNAILFVISDEFGQLNKDTRKALLHEGAGVAVMTAYVELVFCNKGRSLGYESDEVTLRRVIGLKKDDYVLQGKHITKSEVFNLWGVWINRCTRGGRNS